MLSTIISTEIIKATRENLENQGLSEDEVDRIIIKNMFKILLYILIGIPLLFLFANYVMQPILDFIFVDTWSFEIHF